MKKHLLAWVLTVCIVLSLFPMMALATPKTDDPIFLAESDEMVLSEQSEVSSNTPTISIANKQIVATVDEISTNYTLAFGRLTDSGSFTTDPLSKAIENAEATTKADWYVLLQDSNKNDAPQSVYEAFWASCDGIYLRKRAETNVVECTELQPAKDGYHMYIYDEIVGAYSGRLLNLIFWIGDNNTGVSCEATIKIESPRVLYREMARNQTPFYENANQALQEISSLSTYKGNNLYVRFYYGVTGDAKPIAIDPAAQSLQHTAISAGSGTGADGKTCEYYVINCQSFGTDTLSFSTADGQKGVFDVTVTLPFRGFYSAQSRDQEHYLESVTLSELTTEGDNKVLWFMSPNGFGGDKNCLAVTVNGEPGTFTWEKRSGQNIEDMKICLPNVAGASYNVEIYYKNSATNANYRWGSIPVESPGLKYREMRRDHYTQPWYEPNTALSPISNLSVPLANQTYVRFYYGVSANAQALEGTLTSADNTVVKISTSTAADNKTFYSIQGVSLGSTTLTLTVNETTKYDFTITVTPPFYAFFSAQNRDAEHYLPSADWYELTEDKDGNRILWFMLQRCFYADEKESLSVSVAGQPGTFNWVQRGNENAYDLQILLPDRSDSRLYMVEVLQGDRSLSTLSVYVQEPLSDAFFSKRTRDRNFHVSSIYWNNLPEANGDSRAIWYLSENGFSEEEKQTLSVVSDNEGVVSQWVARDRGYDLKIWLPGLQNGNSYTVSIANGDQTIVSLPVRHWLGEIGNAACVDDLVIGFSSYQADGDITIIHEKENGSIYGQGTVEHVDQPYSLARQITFAAATKQTDGTTVVYTKNNAVTESLKVKKIWFEPAYGNDLAFSFSADQHQTAIENVDGNTLPLYVKHGLECGITIWAEIEGTINGKQFSKTVSTSATQNLITAIDGLTRPDNDTVEQLNSYLEELAQNAEPDPEDGIVYHLYLGNTTYNGTIVIPDELQGLISVHIYGKSGGSTVINGGIDLNGSRVTQLRDIHFTANSTETDIDNNMKALYGSGLRQVTNCSFYGYDIAIDSSEGLINAAQGNVFVNNKIATRINLKDIFEYERVRSSDWSKNTFINNNIAVQILFLHERITPYYFRIYNSNFIGNTCDFDFQCPGKFYMYRNYFGKMKPGTEEIPIGAYLKALSEAVTEKELKNLVISNSANINHKGTSAKITWNPRWKFPVADWWVSKTPIDTVFPTTVNTTELLEVASETPTAYRNYLTSEWISETEILNREANDLLIDSTAFKIETEDEKQIAILDGEEATHLGTWIFK